MGEEELIDQYMKPHGEEGIKIIESMNEEHQNISEFAFECVNLGADDDIIDINNIVPYITKNTKIEDIGKSMTHSDMETSFFPLSNIPSLLHSRLISFCQ